MTTDEPGPGLSADDLLRRAGMALAARAAEVLGPYLAGRARQALQRARTVGDGTAAPVAEAPVPVDTAAVDTAAGSTAVGSTAVGGIAAGIMQSGTPARDLLAEVDSAAAAATAATRSGLVSLAMADVDAQRTTPLAVVRAATAGLTAVLRRAGVVPDGDGPSDDPYRLVPGRWSDIDEELGQLALVWGAAKAASHARRHAG